VPILNDDLGLLGPQMGSQLTDDLELLGPEQKGAERLVDDLGLVGEPETVSTIQPTSRTTEEQPDTATPTRPGDILDDISLAPFPEGFPDEGPSFTELATRGAKAVGRGLRESPRNILDMALEVGKALKTGATEAPNMFTQLNIPTIVINALKPPEERPPEFIKATEALQELSRGVIGGASAGFIELPEGEDEQQLTGEEKQAFQTLGSLAGIALPFTATLKVLRGLGITRPFIRELISGGLIGGAAPTVREGIERGIEEGIKGAALVGTLGTAARAVPKVTTAGRSAVERVIPRREPVIQREQPAFVEKLVSERQAGGRQPLKDDIGSEELPVGESARVIKPPKPRPAATLDQSLVEFVKNLEIEGQRGVSIAKAGDLKGEFKALAEQGGRKRGVVKTKAGISLDKVAQAAEEAGFIDSADPALLVEALDRNLRGERVFSIKGERRDRLIELESERELERGVTIEEELRRPSENFPIEVPFPAELEPGSLGFSFKERFRREPRPDVGPSPTANKADIVRFLSDKLNVPIRFGRFRGKALGIFKISPEVVRTKLANDVEVSSHEVGHFLQKSLFPESIRVTTTGDQALRGTVFNRFKDELAPIATKHNNAGGKLVEGFAEFVRRYITHEAEARSVAPGFYKFFDDFLQTKHPDVRQTLLRARDDFDAFLKAPATARVRGQISRVPQKERLNVRSISDRWYTNLVDRVHPIKQFKNTLLQGKEISPAQDPELLARTFPGWVRKADWFVKRGPSDFKTARKAGPGLDEIVEPIRDRWEDFWDYAAARRVVGDFRPKFGEKAIEEKTGLPFKDWEETVRAYQSPEFEAVLEKVQQYEKDIFNYLADSYGLTKDQRTRILQKNYVPFYRIMEEPGTIAKESLAQTGRTFADLPNPIKGFKGSPREIIDPVESIVKNTFTFTNLADRNAVGRAIVELAAKTPGAGRLVEKVPFPSKATQFELAEIKKTMEAAGVDLSEADLSLTATIFRRSPFKPGDNHITVWRNGKQELYRVHPDLYKAILNLDAESAGFLVKLGQPFAEALRVGATTTPEFALGRNPIRDQFSTAINTGLGIKTPYFSAKGIFHVLKSDNLYDLWVRGGGAQSTMVRLSRAEIIERNSRMMRDPALRKTIIRHPWQSLRLITQIGEEMTRLGTFEAKLGPRESATKTDILRAAGESREGGLDFQRGGAKTAAIRQLTAFWNANLQGLDKLRRVATEHPLRFFTQVGAGITLPSILLTLYNMGDARWSEIPQWQKDISWIWLTGPRVSKAQFRKMTAEQKRDLYDNTIYRIPKAHELGIVFGSIPERITEWAAGENPEIGKSLLKTFGAAGFQALIPLPTAFVPLFENWANWSTFMDRPIVPRGLEDLEPAYQAKAHTSELSKAIGEAINFSPAKIDNLVRGVGLRLICRLQIFQATGAYGTIHEG